MKTKIQVVKLCDENGDMIAWITMKELTEMSRQEVCNMAEAEYEVTK